MSIFKNKLLSLIDDSSIKAKSLIDEFSNTVSSIDWDAQLSYFNERKESLLRKGAELLNEFDGLLKQVKDSLTDFVVTVPYDPTSEEIEYSIADGILSVKVSYTDETTTRNNTTDVKLPSNCDVDKVQCEVNDSAKIAKIIVPKIIAEPKTEATAPSEDVANEQPTAEEMPKAKKESSVPKRKSRASRASTKTATTEKKAPSDVAMKISEKLKNKIASNAQHFAQRRAANGRFVRREVTTTTEE